MAASGVPGKTFVLVGVGLGAAALMFGALVAVTGGRGGPAPTARATPGARTSHEHAVDAGVAAAANVPVAPTPAPQAPTVVRVEHATCGFSMFAPDAGVRRLDSDAGVPRLAGVRSAVRCELPDGGVAWEVEPSTDRNEHIGELLAAVFCYERRRDPASVRQEVQTMDREAREDTGSWIVPGLLFRASDRARGRFVRIEGVAHDVTEDRGRTTLAVSIDAVGREVIRVSLPCLADDRVVNGAEVVVYGIGNGSHVERGRLGDEIVVPDVIAQHIEIAADTSDEAEANRLMRRLRRHRY